MHSASMKKLLLAAASSAAISLLVASCGGSGSSSGGGGGAGTANISGVVNGFAATAALMPGEGSSHSARMIAQILNFLSPPLAAGPGGAGVTVQVQGTGISTTTNANGEFTLVDVPVPDTGQVTLLFSKGTVQVSFGLNGIAPGSQVFIGEIDIIDNGVVDARVEVQDDQAPAANDNTSGDDQSNTAQDNASEDDDSEDVATAGNDNSDDDDDSDNSNSGSGSGPG